MHQRTVILQELKKILKNNTQCLEKVYLSRLMSLHISEYPLVLIYGLHETNDLDYFKSTTNTACRRDLDITIDIRLKQENYIDVKEITFYLDEIALEIEQLLVKNNNLNGKCSLIQLNNTAISINDDSENLLGSCILYYDCSYYLDYENNTTQNDFLTAHAKFKTAKKEKIEQIFNVRHKIGGSI